MRRKFRFRRRNYWNIIESVLSKLKTEIMAHNGCMLMRGDSITVQKDEYTWDEACANPNKE